MIREVYKPRKLFSLEEANGTLPLVSRIVKDIVRTYTEVRGAKDVDVSPRMLNVRLSIHLVNTSGPHASAPDGGITTIEPVGPLTVSIRLKQAPKSITMQPEGKPLGITWADGQATVAVSQLDLYAILMVDP